jgi:PhzF family phenazine biosynthesis protein
MSVAYAHVNGFTVGPTGGNPAGVVRDDDSLGLTDAQRRALAAAIGFSETVFVRELYDGSTTPPCVLHFRYFTPTSEVDLCGHATIASLGFLHRTGALPAPTGRIRTLAGDVAYELLPAPSGEGGRDGEDGARVFMEQLPAAIDPPLSADAAADVAAALGAAPLAADWAPRVASTGLRDLLVAIDDADALRAMAPDFARVARVSREHSVIGFHVFDGAGARARGASGGGAPASSAAVAVRNFAPLHGIDEDSATGTSNCALACALRDAGWLDGNATTELDFAQGDGMGAPSRITVRLPTTPGGRPWVGGQFAVVDAARSAALLPSSDPEEEGGGDRRCLVS